MKVDRRVAIAETCGCDGVQEVFAKEEIDLEALQLMDEEDLKQMGIKKGPRMKLIKALGLGAAAKDEL